MTEIATTLWDRATKALKGAEQLLEIDPNGVASRAYYAAFHAVSALFALESVSFNKHKAVEAAVHRDLVLAGRWTKELGADYSYLHRLRNTGDYGGQTHVSISDATQSIECAKRILKAVHQPHPAVFIK